MKIPTILGLLIIFLIAIATVFAATYLRQTMKNNSPEIIPTEIAQNNLSQSSTTITWQTISPTSTEILISKNPNLQPILQDLNDNRDSSDSAKVRLTHITTISNLEPNTPYFFKIKVNNNLYPTSQIQFTTASSSAIQSITSNPIVGTIVDSSLHPISDALVFLIVRDAYPLATGLNENGSFILPLSDLFNTSDPNQPVDPVSLANATMLIQKGGESSKIQLNLTPDLKPLPPIVLGQNFDFRSF